LGEKIIEVCDLYAGYGKFKVLFNVNFSANSGEITVIVGPNGAGKTTLLNSIMGIAAIYSGKVVRVWMSRNCPFIGKRGWV